MPSSEIRQWILFLVAIGVVIFFAVARAELNPWWLMLLGSMLGLGVLVGNVQRSVVEEDEEESQS